MSCLRLLVLADPPPLTGSWAVRQNPQGSQTLCHPRTKSMRLLVLRMQLPGQPATQCPVLLSTMRTMMIERMTVTIMTSIPHSQTFLRSTRPLPRGETFHRLTPGLSTSLPTTDLVPMFPAYPQQSWREGQPSPARMAMGLLPVTDCLRTPPAIQDLALIIPYLACPSAII